MQSIGELVADKAGRVSLHLDVMREIRRQLSPYQFGERPIAGDTVISDGATIDSLTVMDMIMALEDRFEVLIPMNLTGEIHTIDQLAQAVLMLCARR